MHKQSIKGVMLPGLNQFTHTSYLFKVRWETALDFCLKPNKNRIAKISENYTYAVLLMSYVGIFNEHRLPPAPNIRCNCDVEGKSKCCILTA